jgi:hypothetical protein
MKHGPLVALALCFVVAAAACGPDFDPYNRINTLRVLAIQAEPALPAPGETATFTPLVYTPDPAAEVTYHWTWCPFPGSANAGYPCQVSEEQAAMLAGQSGVMLPSFDLGTGKTAQLAHAIDPAVLGQLCQGVPGSPRLPDCEGGFPVQIRVKVSSGGDEVVSVRTQRLRFLPDSQPNANPRIDALMANLDGNDQPITDDPMLTLPRRKKTVIKAQFPEELSELYHGTDDEGHPADVHERLFLTWFVESGDTSDERTGFIFGKTPLEVALKTKWEPARLKDYPKDTARLIVVVHDNRGGVAWRSGAVKLGGGTP